MLFLKQSTACYIPMGPFLDDTDGKTAETGLTIAQADVELAKGNGGFAQKNETSNAPHMGDGWYQVQLNATDTNTDGRLVIKIHKTGALPVWREFIVLPANVYDSLVVDNDKLYTNPVELSTAALNSLADAVLSRAVTNVDSSAVAATLAGLILLAYSRVDGVTDPNNVYVYEMDGTTLFATIPIEDSDTSPSIITKQGVASSN